MENDAHIKILEQGIETWNQWRLDYPDVKPNLKGALLRRANLSGANLTGVDLSEAHLEGANLATVCLIKSTLRRASLCGVYSREGTLYGVTLRKANIATMNLGGMDITWTNLSGANLSKADLREADLSGVDLRGAKLDGARIDKANLTWANLENADLTSAILREADFYEAYLSEACFRRAHLEGAHLEGAKLERTNLSEANLTGANLCRASLVETIVSDVILNECSVYGISVWNLQGTPKEQLNLIITHSYSPYNEPVITVDDLEIAQFLYLLLRNEKLRSVIDDMVQKAVLILGRFTEGRLSVLRAIQEELREYNYLPILFDFKQPASRSITETVSTVAHLSRFIIADLTDPQAIPQELQRIVPNLKVPVVPIFQPLVDNQTGKIKNEWGMFWDFRESEHVLSVYDYDDIEQLLDYFHEDIIVPAEKEVSRILETRKKLQDEKQETRARRTRRSVK